MATISGDGCTIARIRDDRGRWRVSVESWPEAAEWRGRFVFTADDGVNWPAREGPASLRGSGREDVLRHAYEMTEPELRVLLHSLG